MTAFLLWARTELEAGRLIVVIAGAVLKTTGSAVLHSTDRLAPLERTELLFVYSTDPSLELDLIAVLIAEAWLRGMASILATSLARRNLGRVARRLSTCAFEQFARRRVQYALVSTHITAVFTFVEKKVAFFLNCASTAVSFLLALRVTPCVHGHDAHMGATLAIDWESLDSQSM